MTTTNLKDIEILAKNFDNDTLKLSKELKKIQSTKCRLKKQKGKSSYQEDMTKVLQYEQSLKEAKSLLEPKDKTVTTFEKQDIDLLDYDETIKAIKSIQTKKCLSKWLTPIENDNDSYRQACKIESMLLEHKKTVQPIEDTTIRKTELQKIIDTIESNKDLSQDSILDLLNNLM